MNHKNRNLLILAALLLVLGIGLSAYALSSGNAEQEDTTETTDVEPTDTPSTSTTASPQAINDDTALTAKPTIVFTDDGFEQQTYSFPAGTEIIVKNDSSMDMQFSSDDHPAHRDNPELNMALLGAGESGSFTPPGAGTYKFHDHINDQFKGTLVIQ